MTDTDSAAGTSAAETTAPAPAEGAKIESPRLTYAILAVLAVAFVAEIVLSGWQNISLPFFSVTPAALIALGGDYPPAFRDGEWHRLLIAPLLHVDLLHLAFNSLALYFAGSILERLLGRAWLGALYVLGGLSGSILSVAMGADNVVSVGASGAIMALITALAILALRFPSGAGRSHPSSLSPAVWRPTWRAPNTSRGHRARRR